MKLTEVGIRNYKSALLLNESWQNLTETQQIYIGKWETTVWPLVEQYSRLLEAELTPDQIQAIFQNAEKVSIEQGTGLTALGKAGKVTSEVAGKMKAEIEKLLSAAQNSGPVKNMDAQFDKLRMQLANSLKGNPAGRKILQGIDNWKTFADENPAKSAFVIGAMTSLLAFASGGIMSGAAIGFFLKLANNTIKGDKLSTAIGKGVKGAAIGALAGGLSQVIGDLVPADVKDVIIASDGQTIDVGRLEGMQAADIESLTPDAAGDLLKTQNALETALRSVDDPEAQKMIQAEFEKISEKINDLGGQQALQDHAGLEGKDIERSTTTTTDTSAGEEVETIAAEPITAEELKAVGINFDTEPDIAPEVKQWAESKGIDPDQLESWMKMRKGIADAEFLGQEISSSDELSSSFTDGEPSLTQTEINGDVVKVGETFKSTVETKLPGIDKPIGFNSTVRIEGVDSNGNPVYQIKEIHTSTDHPLWKTLPENMSQEDTDQLFKYMQEYTGVMSDSKAGISQTIDTFRQDLAKSIGAAATAAAVGGALADKEVKAGATDLEPNPKQESRNVEYYWDQLDIYEATFGDMMKKAGQGAAKIGQAAAKGLGKAAGVATTKAASAAQRGVAAVKTGAAKAGKELGQKVTVAKLTRAWKAAGEPTDTGSIANILSDVGMSDEQIGLIAKNNKVDLTQTNINQSQQIDLNALADEIKKAGLSDKVKAILAA